MHPSGVRSLAASWSRRLQHCFLFLPSLAYYTGEIATGIRTALLQRNQQCRVFDRGE
jgi:hypothetical protein